MGRDCEMHGERNWRGLGRIMGGSRKDEKITVLLYPLCFQVFTMDGQSRSRIVVPFSCGIYL